jgi:hypothetical protein
VIELLLLVQAITTAALAAVVIKLRRELWPMVAAAGPVDAGFWIRSIDVLTLAAPQFETAKTVIKVRWLFTEELFLRRRFRVYDIAMEPGSRHHYKMWKAWMSGDNRYECEVQKPRGLSKLYNKAIDVFCYDREEEERKWREEVQKYLSLPTKYRKKYRKNPRLWEERYKHS